LKVSLNGGITTLEAIDTHLRQVDAVMLGRSAYHDPYFLHCADAHLSGLPVQARAELLRAFQPYVEAALVCGVALKHMTRHVLGLFAGQPGGRQFRQILSEGAHRPGADWALVERALAATDAALAAA
jgi:tRNA-dihydrouridine synthase A